MYQSSGVRRSFSPAWVVVIASAFASGCGEKQLPVVPDTTAPAPGQGAGGAPEAAPAADPIGAAIQGGDPSLPPGRKE